MALFLKKNYLRENRNKIITFHLDLAKFFLNCSDTEAWMLRSPLAPDILRFQEGKKCSSKPKKSKVNKLLSLFRALSQKR